MFPVPLCEAVSDKQLAFFSKALARQDRPGKPDAAAVL